MALYMNINYQEPTWNKYAQTKDFWLRLSRKSEINSQLTINSNLNITNKS